MNKPSIRPFKNVNRYNNRDAGSEVGQHKRAFAVDRLAGDVAVDGVLAAENEGIGLAAVHGREHDLVAAVAPVCGSGAARLVRIRVSETERERERACASASDPNTKSPRLCLDTTISSAPFSPKIWLYPLPPGVRTGQTS